nr:hypothetical protein Iba_chr06eCG9710 [Ipomoea batatas]
MEARFLQTAALHIRRERKMGSSWLHRCLIRTAPRQPLRDSRRERTGRRDCRRTVLLRCTADPLASIRLRTCPIDSKYTENIAAGMKRKVKRGKGGFLVIAKRKTWEGTGKSSRSWKSRDSKQVVLDAWITTAFGACSTDDISKRQTFICPCVSADPNLAQLRDLPPHAESPELSTENKHPVGTVREPYASGDSPAMEHRFSGLDECKAAAGIFIDSAGVGSHGLRDASFSPAVGVNSEVPGMELGSRTCGPKPTAVGLGVLITTCLIELGAIRAEYPGR